MNILNEWHIREYTQAEEALIHQPIEKEYLFYKAVESGNIEYIEEDFKNSGFRNQAGKGILSRNPLRNIKNHFIVTTTMVTRVCVSGGLSQEEAFRLSDFYILKADESQSIDEVCTLHHQMVLDFTTRMRSVNTKPTLSKPIHRSIEYIYAHIHSRITVEDLAKHVNLSASHLSRLFKQETGISVSDYIRTQKIERAKNLLRYSDYTYVEISNYLSFDSQSHFIQTFKKYEGITPKNYRDKFYRSVW